MAPKPTSCIFCWTRTRLTDEDVIPHWLDDLYKRNPQNRSMRFLHGHDGDRRQVGVTIKARKAVCAKCNNGWMSRLQQAARPFIIRLSHPDRPNPPLRIPAQDQRTLARWAVMTAMTAEFANVNDRPSSFTREERWAFYAMRQLPTWSGVFLARRAEQADPSAVWMHGQSLRLSPTGPRLSGTLNGHVQTVVVGHMVLKLLLLRSSFVTEHEAGVLLDQHAVPWRVHRIRGITPVSWPPRFDLTRDEVHAMSGESLPTPPADPRYRTLPDPSDQ